MRRKIVVTLVGLLVTIVGSSMASPYFAIDGQSSWQEALDGIFHAGSITGMTTSEWADYYAVWQSPNEGPKYPACVFSEADLYVSPGTEACSPVDLNSDGTINMVDFFFVASNWLSDGYDVLPHSYPEEPGLVMAWASNDLNEEDPTSSAWVFTYGDDPDLTDTAITVSVGPVTGINVVSFGMRDEDGNIKAWYWECGPAGSGAPLIINQRNRLIIYPSSDGVAATDPPATSFVKENGFDITRVIDFIADENNVWVGAVAVPPPGQTLARPWNYWWDLTVSGTPQISIPPLPDGQFYKWRQPARYIGTTTSYLGWGDPSVDYQAPLLADDWHCTDDREVIALDWWGGFKLAPTNPGIPISGGWKGPGLPSVPPTGFHLGVWTDVPGDIQDITVISHPGEMIWEQVCTDYNWDFAGNSIDPRTPPGLPPAPPLPALPPPPAIAGIYRFSCDLDPNFVQDPNSNNVYWLSIAAIYDSGTPTYAWSWNTRPHHYNDGAVRITSVGSGGWPPTVGDQWSTGMPVETPRWIPWDLSFQLITDEDDPNCCPCP